MTAETLPRGAWVAIDLGALERNYWKLARHVAPAKVLAVVKADAYGHGAVEVARTLAPLGVAAFGVATLAEGAALRHAGIESEIVVLSPVPAAGIGALFAHRLTPAVSSLSALRAVREQAEAREHTVAVHLKVDTGMSRLGISPAELPAALETLRASGRLRLAGLMSHLADAERPESATNVRQTALFGALSDAPSSFGFPDVVRHLANSAAAIHLPETRFDQVRIGLALHGYDPAGRDAAGLGLEPTMSVEAEIVQVRDLAVGGRVGYGGRFVASRPTRVATVPVGYADGYSWRLGTRAEALVGGVRVPVIGSVSMDLLALDVTDVGGREGDRVTLLGSQEKERISASELAEHVGSIPYQLLCLFGMRLERRYVRATEAAA